MSSPPTFNIDPSLSIPPGDPEECDQNHNLLACLINVNGRTKGEKRAGDSVEAGRAYVAAYVDYLHFVESVNTVLAAKMQFDYGNEITDLEDRAHAHSR